MRTFKRIFILLSSSFLFFGKTNAQTDNKLIYTYLDKNGNAYLISKNQLEYKPIKAIESSSGTYNGGEPLKSAIKAEQFQILKDLLKKCLAKTEIHLKQRIKPSAFVEEIGKKSAILVHNAPEVLLLEAKLKEFLGKKE